MGDSQADIYHKLITVYYPCHYCHWQKHIRCPDIASNGNGNIHQEINHAVMM